MFDRPNGQCRIDFCEPLGSDKRPENGIISRYEALRQMCIARLNYQRDAMPLQLAIVSDHKDLLGDDCVREFREDGGTIGRAFGNDWILPDPDRLISGQHATVDFQAGTYYLADVSTNGVFVNGELEPIGKGNPRRLFNGDKLRMGDFEFEVSLDEGEGLTMPPPEPMTVVPDHVERLVAEESIKTGVELLGAEEIIGDEEIELSLFGESVEDKATESNNGEMNSQANPFAPAPTTAQVRRLDLENVLDAFMRGLDISRADLHPSTDPLEVMENAGRALKEFVDGSSDLLARRAALKAMFRLDQTTALPRDNNPLKFAKNARDSMMQLLIGKKGQYVGPVDAVKEVFEDLKIHHDAVLEGMMAAFVEYIDRFNPDDLQENFNRTLDKKPLFRVLNQLKYWQLYRDLYPIMTQQTTGTFPHQFGEDFARLYDKHVAEMKRPDRAGDRGAVKMLKETVPVIYDKDNLVDQTD